MQKRAPMKWSRNIPLFETLYVDFEFLYRQFVSAYNQPDHDSNVYLCFQNNAPGTVGIAYLGNICGQQSYKTAIVEYLNDDISTGEVSGPAWIFFMFMTLLHCSIW